MQAPQIARPSVSIPELSRRLQDGARQLEAQFLGKEEIIRLLFVSALAGEHLVMVGPPGTAKSALIRAFAGVIEARYFDYLLTRFTEPNEIFGPVDIKAFREGTYRRRLEGMLPEALRAQARVTGRIVQFPAHDALEIERYLAAVREAGLHAEDVEIRKADLEDVFLDVMQKHSGKAGQSATATTGAAA